MQTNDNFQWTDNKVIAFVKYLYDRHPNNEMYAKIEQFKKMDAFGKKLQQEINSEMWFSEAKKEKPKEWEIVAYKIADNIFIREHNEKNYFNVNGRSFFERISEEKLPLNKEIHSVKRLSDGEVFKVGEVTNYGEVTRFEIIDDEVLASYYKEYFVFTVCADCGRVSFNKLKKAKPILFTTSDGIDVREGDRVWFVDKDSFEIDFYDFNVYANGKEDLKHYPAQHLYFSTEAKAKEYVLWNKPALSLSEIKEVLERTCNLRFEAIEEGELIRLVKSKINS
jgi:hypothetical protein